mgnify:CR=1 FL=1
MQVIVLKWLSVVDWTLIQTIIIITSTYSLIIRQSSSLRSPDTLAVHKLKEKLFPDENIWISVQQDSKGS